MNSVSAALGSGVSATSSRCRQLLQMAQAKATETITFVQEKIAETGAAVAQTATSVQSSILARIEDVKCSAEASLTSLRERRARFVSRITNAKSFALRELGVVRELATKEYSKARSLGLRKWTVETGAVTIALVRKAVLAARCNASAAYVRTLAFAVAALASAKARVRGGANSVYGRLINVASRSRARFAEVQISIVQRVSSAASGVREQSAKLGHNAQLVINDGKFHATAVGAAGGAAALGASGAATGLAAGGVVGAVVGLVPAVFTFGLSVPIGAAIGGGAGLVTGAAVGTAAGAVGGGATGYGVYTERDQIKKGTQQTLQRVSSGAKFVKASASASAEFAKEKASEMRNRFVRSQTGGA
eukprot:TRINITY_DN2176_c0_g1_i1.p1 TRINITY_DN2176_c0_g1~~TRINITY_DN2176_c0_g1_i1.p1  ORF type:complete len:362 (-),score=66.61 TRINITY_DN2176_c0_g1_i1:174-1259(-)